MPTQTCIKTRSHALLPAGIRAMIDTPLDLRYSRIAGRGDSSAEDRETQNKVEHQKLRELDAQSVRNPRTRLLHCLDEIAVRVVRQYQAIQLQLAASGKRL